MIGILIINVGFMNTNKFRDKSFDSRWVRPWDCTKHSLKFWVEGWGAAPQSCPNYRSIVFGILPCATQCARVTRSLTFRPSFHCVPSNHRYVLSLISTLKIFINPWDIIHILITYLNLHFENQCKVKREVQGSYFKKSFVFINKMN